MSDLIPSYEIREKADGWTPAENAEWERLHGPLAAARYRAACDRVWLIVAELRADAGAEPYRDPMAQRLSAALVGVEDGTETEWATESEGAQWPGGGEQVMRDRARENPRHALVRRFATPWRPVAAVEKEASR